MWLRLQVCILSTVILLRWCLEVGIIAHIQEDIVSLPVAVPLRCENVLVEGAVHTDSWNKTVQQLALHSSSLDIHKESVGKMNSLPWSISQVMLGQQNIC